MFPSQLHFLTQNSGSLSFDCTWRMHSRASSLGSWRSLPCSDANSEVCTGLCHAQRWCLEGKPPWSQVTLRKWFSEWNIQVPLLPRYTVYRFQKGSLRVQQYLPHVPLNHLSAMDCNGLEQAWLSHVWWLNPQYMFSNHFKPCWNMAMADLQTHSLNQLWPPSLFLLLWRPIRRSKVRVSPTPETLPQRMR